jgi:predicted PurR-regulated permease PerM
MSAELNEQPTPDHESPLWSRSTKIIVTVAAILLVLWFAYRFQSLISQLVMAAILAYILNPIIILIDKRTKLKRSSGILLVYLALAIGTIGAFVALGIAAFEQIGALIREVPTLIEETTAIIQRYTSSTEPIGFGPLSIAPDTIDWPLIQEQLLGLVEPVVSRGGQIVTELATATVRLLGNLFFIFVISIYFAIEIPRLSEHVGNLAHQPGYRHDAERVMREFGRIWSAYLRGQVILGLIIFLVVWIGLAILGVQNSLALGLLSGLLEFIPVIGPVIGAGTAVIVAFFQPDTMGALASWQYAGIVLIFMFIVQQLENNVLVPRIVGESLDLHPLIVMIGVFVGGSLAGILGAILAAPVVATLKMIGIYAWRKMFDLPPFPKPEATDANKPPSLLEQGQSALARLRKQMPSKSE